MYNVEWSLRCGIDYDDSGDYVEVVMTATEDGGRECGMEWQINE